MYDKYPVFDIPQNNFVQRFFAQSWGAIVIEIALTIVLSAAAGYAFDFFGPFESHRPAFQAVSSDALAADSRLERAARHVSDGQYDASLALLNELISAEPDAANYHAWRAYANMMTGEYAAAQRDYRRLLQLEPADYDAHNGMCWAYGELGHFTSALGHCNIALALAGSSFDQAVTLENRCWLRVEMGELDAAAGDCRAVLRAYPSCNLEVCALAHYNLGRVLLAQRQLDRALRHFNLALYIGSSYPEMYLEIGEVYAKLGYQEAARTSFERFAALPGVEVKG